MNKFEKLKNLTVLYVEDEEDVREEVVDILNLKVAELYVATNGQEGYDQYKQNQPDIIITDIKMPIIDGIEMISKIRQEDLEIPIVITSAFNETEFFKTAIDLHVDKYIIKPIDIVQLFSVLNRAALVIYQKKELLHKDAMLKNKEKISALGELLQNIAHQWRQPLSMITTSASSLQVQKYLGKINDELIDEMCENINTNAQNLSQTIEKFANFFNNEESVESVNLKQIIEEYHTIINATFEKEGIVLVYELENINIKAVRKDIVQIVVTLLSNAKDILLLTQSDDKYIQVKLYNDNEKIVLSVQDSGGGVNDRYIDKVFDPYFTTKHKSQGTGLGLYLVYELIRDFLHGEITVSNEYFTCENKQFYGARFMTIL